MSSDWVNSSLDRVCGTFPKNNHKTKSPSQTSVEIDFGPSTSSQYRIRREHDTLIFVISPQQIGNISYAYCQESNPCSTLRWCRRRGSRRCRIAWVRRTRSPVGCTSHRGFQACRGTWEDPRSLRRKSPCPWPHRHIVEYLLLEGFCWSNKNLLNCSCWRKNVYEKSSYLQRTKGGLIESIQIEVNIWIFVYYF